MRKTIYVKSQEQWDGVKLKAEESGLSISEYLLGGEIRELPAPNQPKIFELLAEMDRKIDLLWSFPLTAEKNPVAPQEMSGEKIDMYPGTTKPKEFYSEELMKPVSVSRDELIAPLKEKVEQIQGKPLRSFSKAEQLGKKGGGK